MTEASLPSPGADRGQERRARERYPGAAPGLIVSAGKDARWARVKDVSVSGIGLLLAEPFEPGTVLSVRLRTPQEAPVSVRTAVVVHAKPQTESGWLVGCAFKDPLTLEQFQGLV